MNYYGKSLKETLNNAFDKDRGSLETVQVEYNKGLIIKFTLCNSLAAVVNFSKFLWYVCWLCINKDKRIRKKTLFPLPLHQTSIKYVLAKVRLYNLYLWLENYHCLCCLIMTMITFLTKLDDTSIKTKQYFLWMNCK